MNLNIHIVFNVYCFWCVLVSLSTTKAKPTNNIYVWLTVSPEIERIDVNGTKQTLQRRLELNWKISENLNESWIGLFDYEVNENTLNITENDALVYVNKLSNEGMFRTRIEFPEIEFQRTNLSWKCLDYWIAFVRSDNVIASNCIKSNPTWMKDNLIYIEDKSVKQIMIPGSHNAGSYESTYKKSAANTLKKYAICHDQSVFNQLVFGVRYLDIRVAYEEVKGRRSKYWIAHGVLRMDITLDSVLQQVKQFIEATDKEIIILDFHRFEKGFEEINETVSDEVISRHRQVIKLVSRYLRKYLVNKTRGFDTKIKDILRDNKRVIVGYAKHNLFNDYFLFPRVKHLWADTDDVQRLEEYFNQTLCNHNTFEPQSAMAQLTPDAWGVVFDKYGGTRKLSRIINPIISRWFRERWWICANIVSVDFVLSNDIIDTSIKANQLRNFAIRNASRTRFWTWTRHQ